ncbi:MAG: preprotein translocase subunit YajC [Candidatus Omnitrophica bacterium]|nr:preprotein translocase subunit YajC [Candidatus Omnitrophota bacterium]MDD5488970.1 preprotein translocase subunit YajC [Candidatus Omnitrophota bacterium]
MLTLAFAQDAGASQSASTASGSPMGMIYYMLVVFAIFYFLLIRPQKKQQKEHQNMLEAIKKNDEVITSGGMYGTVVNIQNDIVTLRVDDNTRIKVQKSAISGIKKTKKEE